MIIQNKVHFLNCLWLSNELKTLQGERWYRTIQATISLFETASILLCSSELSEAAGQRTEYQHKSISCVYLHDASDCDGINP